MQPAESEEKQYEFPLYRQLQQSHPVLWPPREGRPSQFPRRLPEPHVLAEEIADDLRSALEQIESVLADLQQRATAVAPDSARLATRASEDH